jgi:hypothetical protein
MDTVRAAIYFCSFCPSEHLFLLLNRPQWLPRFFFSSWNSLAVTQAAPSFVLSQNMSHSDNVQTVMSAVTSQVKLCPYDEEELAIWFRLIEAQFISAGIKWQKFRYANALALGTILDTVNACKESD